MTFDYADFADEDFGDGETAVTLSLEGAGSPGHGIDDAVTFVTRALGGDVTLRFTLPPEDTLDLVARVIRYTADDPRRVHEAVEHALAWRADEARRAAKARWAETGGGPEPEGLLDADEVWGIGLDPTGRDGDPRHPFTEADLTETERAKLARYRLREAVELARLDWDQDDPENVARSTYAAARSIRDSLRLPEYPGDERVWTWVDYSDAQSAAYRRVLAATDEEVEALRD